MKKYTLEELKKHWENLVDKYPIISNEDVLEEEDWDRCKLMTKNWHKVQLAGDDLFGINIKRLSKGIATGLIQFGLVLYQKY